MDSWQVKQLPVSNFDIDFHLVLWDLFLAQADGEGDLALQPMAQRKEALQMVILWGTRKREGQRKKKRKKITRMHSVLSCASVCSLPGVKTSTCVLIVYKKKRQSMKMWYRWLS